jgi:hypothetical protein
VNGLGSFFVGGFDEARYLTGFLVEPVPVVGDPVFVLDLDVLPVGIGHRIRGQPFHTLVVVMKGGIVASPSVSLIYRSPPASLV